MKKGSMIFNYYYFVVYDRKPTDPLCLVRIMSYFHSSIFHFFFSIFSQLDGQITAVTRSFYSGQMTSAPLLIKVKDIQSTRTMIEELIKLQFEVISHFQNSLPICFFAFDSNIGRFIYVE
jgi:hypothetical protein